MTEEQTKEGWIYVLQAPEGGPIKVGHTERTPEDRCAEISKHWPCALKIIGAWKGTREDEKVIHRELADSRIEKTEWFAQTTSVHYFLVQSGCRGWRKHSEPLLHHDYHRQVRQTYALKQIIEQADFLVRQLQEQVKRIEETE